MPESLFSIKLWTGVFLFLAFYLYNFGPITKQFGSSWGRGEDCRKWGGTVNSNCVIKFADGYKAN